jgi:transcriptional regulator with XRE-family HTH domain
MARVAYLFGKRLAAAREERLMTQRELGDLIGGVSDETISRIERHEVAGILSKRLPKLAETLGFTLEEFKNRFLASEALATKVSGGKKGDGVGLVGGLPTGIDLRRARPARVLPEFGIGVAASRRVDKEAEHPDGNRLVGVADRRAFVAPVDGDCQHPKWRNGELVVFSFEAVEREGLLPGRSYYLAFSDGSTTFKRLFTDEKDPEVYVLRCWNRKKYPSDQRVHREEVVRIARAVSKQVMVEEGD